MGKFQNFLGKTSRKKKKVFNDNLFDTFEVTTTVVNREMIDRFQRVIFRMKKVLINKVAKSRSRKRLQIIVDPCWFKEVLVDPCWFKLSL